MKDTMTISLDKEIKQRFSQFAQSLGTNPTNLINMMIVHSMHTGSITFKAPNSYFEVERFSANEMEDLNNSSSIQSGMKKIKDALGNVSGK